jgi:hypothetical protein
MQAQHPRRQRIVDDPDEGIRKNGGGRNGGALGFDV